MEPPSSHDKDILRIMISTDNHLGVWEKDEVRKMDSFLAFEEILKRAAELKVDMVLLGGDLFHENKPSRNTVVKAIELMKKYCLNDKPVQFQILSDQASAFVAGHVNYQDPNLNVGLPIFTIHGNHDDPSGAENLSAVDILSSCGLVNYFGKVNIGGTASNAPGKLDLAPILVQKGVTKVALYGLGNIRDERLGRLFNTAGAVTWLQPQDMPGYPRNEWWNMFVLHQNRVLHGPQAKNAILESHMPDFLDFVVWGHEHECKPKPEVLKAGKARTTNSYVLQPGSSVATALSEGEAARKHFFVLEVYQEQHRVVEHALESQRPFVYDQVILRDVRDPAPLKPEDVEGVTSYLEDKVNAMIHKATVQATAESPMPPLIRLKVDYTGYSTINAQRFGQKFVGKVANPQDMLTFTKAAARRAGAGGVKDEKEGGLVDANLLRPEALDQARIEDLIQDNLQESLKLLKEEELALALHNFVEKDEKNALADCINSELQERLKGTATRKVTTLDAPDDTLKAQLQQAQVEDRAAAKPAGPRTGSVADRAASQQLDNVRRGVGAVSADGMEVDGDEGDVQPSGRAGPSQAAAKPPNGRGRGGGRAGGRATAGRGKGDKKQQNLLDTFAAMSQRKQAATATAAGGTTQSGEPSASGADDLNDEIEDDAPATGRGRGGRGGARGRGGRASGGASRGRGRGKAARADSDDDAVMDDEPSGSFALGGGDDLMDDEDEAPARGKRKATGATPAKARPQRKAAAAAGSRKRTKLDSDDEAALGDDSDEEEYVGGKGEESDDDIDDDDEDDDVIEDDDLGGPRKRQKRSAGAGRAAAGGRGKSQATTAAAGGRARGGAAATPAANTPARDLDDDAIIIDDSDDEGGKKAFPQKPAAAAPSTGAATGGSLPQPTSQAGGARRRMLPSSVQGATQGAGTQGTQGTKGGRWGSAR